MLCRLYVAGDVSGDMAGHMAGDVAIGMAGDVALVTRFIGTHRYVSIM